MKEYFGKINKEYEVKGAIIWAIYRHSFIHNGEFAKIFNYKKKNLSVGFGFGNNFNHLHVEKNLNQTFYIDIPTLINDYNEASNIYIEDVKTKDDLVENFNNYHLKIREDNQLELETFIKGGASKWISREDLKFLD